MFSSSKLILVLLTSNNTRLLKKSHFSGISYVTSIFGTNYNYGTESKPSHYIQPNTTRKINAQPIRMLGNGTVTARHEPYRNYFPRTHKKKDYLFAMLFKIISSGIETAVCASRIKVIVGE